MICYILIENQWSVFLTRKRDKVSDFVFTAKPFLSTKKNHRRRQYRNYLVWTKLQICENFFAMEVLIWVLMNLRCLEEKHGMIRINFLILMDIKRRVRVMIMFVLRTRQIWWTVLQEETPFKFVTNVAITYDLGIFERFFSKNERRVIWSKTSTFTRSLGKQVSWHVAQELFEPITK